jgi:hypothetical protein
MAERDRLGLKTGGKGETEARWRAVHTANRFEEDEEDDRRKKYERTES